MASVSGLANISLPSFGPNMDPKDAAAIRNYLYQMQEQLQYILRNLDETNMAPDSQLAAAASRESAGK